MNHNEFEVLAPAGSFETFKAVIEAGADAVYVGGSQFGARAYANNFDEIELQKAIDYAHLKEKSVYLTVNTLLKNQEIENQLYDYLLPYYENGLDAVIVQDFGALSFIRSAFPNLPVHTSTQMTVSSAEGARLMEELGATRIVTAREMSLAEIVAIHDQVPNVEIETFVHGALCYCYSGQCLFSSMLGGRSGNRGRCAQPCRLSYSVLDENKKNLLNDSFVLSPKDLCGIELLPQMKKAGIYSLKIEGRMKQAQYAAGVVSFYRKYVDQLLANEMTSKNSFHISEKDYKDLENLGNRSGFTNQYFYKQNGPDMITFDKPSHQKSDELLQNKITDLYINHQKKIPVYGFLTLKKGEIATLNVSTDLISVQVNGTEVSEAKNKPLLINDVDSRMRKTGDSLFEFEQFEIDMDDDVFMPVGALNQLRRDALEKLSDSILAPYKREVSSVSKKERSSESFANIVCTCNRMICSTENREFINLFLEESWIHDIYIDSCCYESISDKNSIFDAINEDVEIIHANNKNVFYIFPHVFRKKTVDFYKQNIKKLQNIAFDGFVIHNYDSLHFVNTYLPNAKIIMDHNMYTYNDYSSEAFKEQNAFGNTIPIELNKNEIRHRDNRNSEIILYGYYPLMTSAQCVLHNVVACKKHPQTLYLKDRYQKLFPVRNHCGECYNTIYNSLPVCLINQKEELMQMGIHAFRFHFTVESKKETRDILKQIRSGELSIISCTKGHYKRGVE